VTGENRAEPLAEELAALLQKLEEFKPRLDAHRIRHEHLAADLVMAGYGASVWDAGNAVALLSRDGLYMSATFPVARLAFETGMDALYLATSTDYDRAGSKAYVFERFEYADIRADLGAAFNVEGFEDETTEYAAVSTSLTEMAQDLDKVRTGQGQEILSAMDHFLPKFKGARRGKRHPGNWAEISRRKMASELEQREGPQGVAERLKAAYSGLSRSSHPRLRLEAWEPNRNAPGPAFRPKAKLGVVALRMTELGVDLVASALRRIADQQSPHVEA
jgi:hypothetical protein